MEYAPVDKPVNAKEPSFADKTDFICTFLSFFRITVAKFIGFCATESAIVPLICKAVVV